MRFSLAISAVLLSVLCAQGTPLSADLESRHNAEVEARVGLKFHILVGTPPAQLTGATDDDMCTPEQAAAIERSIVDAKSASAVARKILGVPKMEKSNGFFWMFGGAAVAPSEVSRHFSFVQKLGTPDHIASTVPFENSPNDLIFTCIPAGTKKAAEVLATTVNSGRKTKNTPVTPVLNLIRISPIHFLNTRTMAQAASAMNPGGVFTVKNGLQTDQGVQVPPLAFTIIHEVQHSNVLMDNAEQDHLVDQKIGPKRAYGFQQVQNLDAHLKHLNPQNYAFFALLAESNPEFFKPDCFISEQLPIRDFAAEKRAKSVVKTKAKPVARPPSKPAAKPVPKPPVVKPAVKPVAKPVTKPAVKPVTKPAAKPVAKPAAKPIAKPAAKPVVKPAAKPVVKPAAKPAAKQPVTAKPVAKPAAKPGAKPPAKPVAKPAAKPAAKPTTKPVPGKPVAKKPAAVKPTPAKKPAPPTQSKAATKSAPASAKPSASAKASTACSATAAVCKACAKIVKGIPGDVQLANFDDGTE
ncbi:unnamed protein product [Mycena citricolor]|uniref:Lysine-specific metallo-endopeptidase domain-containing protein n=1 Tax=Mycena citricolor TaxID=2018698 RepID=A0AAD2HUS0_9AGAR|nr:unnamed protein product [Mycena citricolor]